MLRYTPITEVDFNESVWRPIYESEGSYDTVSAHHLAILFLILAIGTLLDLEREAHSPEAMQFYHYGRAALSIDCVLEEQTIAGIQAMVCLYILF